MLSKWFTVQDGCTYWNFGVCIWYYYYFVQCLCRYDRYHSWAHISGLIVSFFACQRPIFIFLYLHLLILALHLTYSGWYSLNRRYDFDSCIISKETIEIAFCRLVTFHDVVNNLGASEWIFLFVKWLPLFCVIMIVFSFPWQDNSILSEWSPTTARYYQFSFKER